MKFNVTPMECGSCAVLIPRLLKALDPGAEVKVDLLTGTVDVDGKLEAGQVVATLAGEGYSAVLAEPAAGHCCGSCHH
jgi:copper chaperone